MSHLDGGGVLKSITFMSIGRDRCSFILPSKLLSSSVSSVEASAHTSSEPGLLIDRLQHCQPEWNVLESKYNLLQSQGNRQQFIKKCQSGTFDGVVGLYRTNSIAETGNFNQSLISLLPSTLRYIGHNGAGYDNVDVQACAVRDVAMFLILGTLRNTMIHEAVRNNEWKGSTPIGRVPEGKVPEILRMGSVGQAFARRAGAFGMKIIYYDRSRLPANKEGDVRYVTMDELLEQFDIVSLSLPLTAATQHLISSPEIEKMKEGAVTINTARGPLLDEEALVKGLQTGKVMLLPHLGTTTVGTKREMKLLAIRNLESALDKGELLTPFDV
ncbi:D-mandelate dehydrogenase-like dehydrogenase [Aspergillus undulatus]|uniref:D-mandelate dehydrogenase-like dehydrogenase n=1 Tax=Aspergillus undulatus TaxID=1810928 RepID=UPI003CCD1B56